MLENDEPNVRLLVAERVIKAMGAYKGGMDRLEICLDHPEFDHRMSGFADQLVSECEADLPPEERSSWRIIPIGTYKSVTGLEAAVRKCGCHLGDWRTDLLKPISLAKEPAKLSLVRAAGSDLGFPSRATRQEIYDAGLSLGWTLCPHEVGPQLRIHYKDQPVGEAVNIASEPIVDGTGNSRLFRLEHNEDGLWLHEVYGYHGYTWKPETIWVFCR